MIIYDKMQCDACKNEYKGVFKVSKEGNIGCQNCNEPIRLDKTTYKEVSLEEPKVTQEVVKDLLRKDLKRIYIAKVEEGKDALHKIRDENNNIDPAKMYFQNNKLDLILRMQRSAYAALKYMEAGENLPYYAYAKKMYEQYISARNKRFTEDEEREIEVMLISDEMKEIMLEVEE